jgi:hypothetical protein
MRGFRQEAILAIVLLLLIFLALAGCTKTCPPVKTIEKRPITERVETFSEEPYVETEIKVIGKKCIEKNYSQEKGEISDARFNISIGEKEWISKPPVLGETNYLRRIVKIYNDLDKIDTTYLDKIYLYNGTETSRSKNPMMFMVDPKSTRTLYVVWNTQYDPMKDVTVDFTNKTEVTGQTVTTMRMCYNETEKVNTTKYKKISNGMQEEIKGYDSVVKVKIPRNC